MRSNPEAVAINAIAFKPSSVDAAPPGPNLSLINDKPSHGDVYKLLDALASGVCSRGHIERLPALQHDPAHPRVLGRNGYDRFPVTPALLHPEGPAAHRIRLVLRRCQRRPGA